MKNFWIIIGSILMCVIIGLSIFFGATPTGREVWNNWWHNVQVADDDTNYETKKQVENTCRAMIASYNADKLIWEQYRESEKSEEVGWANNAKIRANQTASTYNNYILLNNYVWENNVPADILITLSYLV